MQLVIGDNIDSNHHPLIVRLKEGRNRGSGENRGEKVGRGAWDKKGKVRFRQELGGIG